MDKKIIKTASFLLITISIFIKIQGDILFNSGFPYPSWKVFQHLLFIGFVGLLLINNLISKKKNIFYNYEFIRLFLLAMIFLGESLVLMFLRSGYTTDTFKQLSFLICAFLGAYLVLNTFTFDEIDNYLKILFLFIFIRYLFLVKDDLFSIDAWTQISYIKSSSPFESSSLSGFFYGFMIYFTLVKRDKLFTILSVLSVILVFKRINVIFAIIFLLIGGHKSMMKKDFKINKFLLPAIFIIIPIVSYDILVTGKLNNFIYNTFENINMKNILMGRNVFLSSVLESSYKSTGYGSTMLALSENGFHGLEMDGVGVFIELGLLGVVAFSICVWSISKNLRVNNILLLLFFLNYCTSAQLSDTYIVLLNVLCVGINNIKYDESRGEVFDFSSNERLQRKYV